MKILLLLFYIVINEESFPETTAPDFYNISNENKIHADEISKW